MRRVVLVGAGHAHVEVLRRWARRRPPGLEVVLVTDRSRAIYSGMVPGFVAGRYARGELEIDVARLARRAGALVVEEGARRISGADRLVETDAGSRWEFDWAALDVGSTVQGISLPGVRLHALAVRPMDGFVKGFATWLGRLRAERGGRRTRWVVVGGGAAGVELALCVEARLRRELGRPPRVLLVDRGEGPLRSAHPRLARRVDDVLARRGIVFEGGAIIRAVDGGSVLLADGRKLEGDRVLWAAGPAAHGWLAAGDLPLDAAGFVRVRPTLQVEGGDRVFAAGDCASLPGMGRAGVYAVRAGPVLEENLRRALQGRQLRVFRPQRHFLSLLNLGDGTALGARGAISFEGRWVMRLKDHIDRRFVERYR